MTFDNTVMPSLMDFINDINDVVNTLQTEPWAFEGHSKRLTGRLTGLETHPVTYKVNNSYESYEIEMQRSKTFDLYLSYPGSEGVEEVGYQLSSIDELKSALTSICSGDTRDHDKYILDFLDLLPMVYTDTLFNTRPKHPDGWSYNLRLYCIKIQYSISILGTLLHGLTTIDFYHYSTSYRTIFLDYKYGQLTNLKIIDNSRKQYDVVCRVTYANDSPMDAVYSWTTIQTFIYSRWHYHPSEYELIYAHIYNCVCNRLIADGRDLSCSYGDGEYISSGSQVGIGGVATNYLVKYMDDRGQSTLTQSSPGRVRICIYLLTRHGEVATGRTYIPINIDFNKRKISFGSEPIEKPISSYKQLSGMDQWTDSINTQF